jgi:hypothetical protein
VRALTGVAPTEGLKKRAAQTWLVKLMMDKARIIKIVRDYELKLLFGSLRYVLASARLLVKIVKKILPKPK